jgi:hypothetical protein
MTETIDQMTDDDNPIEDRPGAILIKDDPTGQTAVQFEWVADLSKSDYERFSKALNALADIHGSNLFAYVRHAGLALMREVGEAYKAAYENRISHLQTDDIEEWCIRVRTAVLGMCSAIHHHQEQSYIEVRRRFPDPPPDEGEEEGISPERAAMKTAFATLYDNCFGYRFLYRLRHAMIHYTMSACGVGAESQRYEGKNYHFFELTLDRSIMLEQRSFLNATLRRELEELDEDPDIVEMMTEAFRELVKTNRRVVEILHPDIAEICATVVEFDNLLGGQDGVRAISRNRSRELKRPFKFAYRPISGHVIMAARKYFDTNDEVV